MLIISIIRITQRTGKTAAGGDYYYSYGQGLFIVLNTNNYNVAEHQKTIEEAVAAYPDAAWRVVTIHQDIYGSGLDHSDTDGMILRTQLTPVFDSNDIDVVLQGHDHTYSRSKMLYGDGQTHGKYEFRLNEAWLWIMTGIMHTNVDTEEQITLAPRRWRYRCTGCTGCLYNRIITATPLRMLEGNTL